jgi:hypothetical protein
MSHWMTSGKSRLQAKQNRSFAQRAQQRANVVAPGAMMIQSYATGPSGQDHPRKRRRSEGKISIRLLTFWYLLGSILELLEIQAFRFHGSDSIDATKPLF